MARHLNGWSALSLTGPEQWTDALVASRQWLDYSARNQMLLASYGVDGPVAGQETWRLVPSTSDERPCAVRAGKHGWPVRVPITTGGSEPDPYLYGTHPSRSRTERFEWRPVFAVDQLVRRPTPGALVPVEAPDQLPGRTGAATFLDAIRKVARTTVRGRLPAWERPPPDPDRNRRAALTRREGTAARTRTRRAGRMAGRRPSRSRPGELPAWDPEPLEPRDRWQRLQACWTRPASSPPRSVSWSASTSPPARPRRWTSSTTARCPPGASLAASPPMYPASFRRGLSPSCRPWSRPTRRRRLRRADRYSAEISARCALRS
jgi:hypothetical protein